MKTLNVPMEEQYHAALERVQQYYSVTSGVRVSKAQALKRLLWESAQMLDNKGKLWEKEGDKA